MKTQRIVEILKSGVVDTDIVVKGWVRTKRGNKNVAFIALNDGSCVANIQVVVDLSKFGEEELKPITTGACIRVDGRLVESLGSGQRVEVQAAKIEVYGTADPETYPLQKKGHSLEFLREIAYLRPRTNTFGAVLRIRHAMAYAIHEYFNKQGFYYFHTPLITASDCEGAGAMFQVTTLDLNDVPKTDEGKVDYAQDFFGKSCNLTVSGQLEGELGALSLGRIYTFGPTFRAENSNTPRHASEFWMIEPEAAFYELEVNGVVYGLSRFVNGILADRMNARWYMAVGLALCALANFAFGFGEDVSYWITGQHDGSQFTNTMILFMGIMWVINGMLQGTGFPPCARLLTHWIPPTELATKMSVWNTSHSIGAGLVVILCGYIMGTVGMNMTADPDAVATIAANLGVAPDDAAGMERVMASAAHVGAWKWCFWVPSAIAFAGAIGLVAFLRDTPSSVGLPELEGTEVKVTRPFPF